MIGPARWALSPLDCCVHLLVPSDDQPTSVLTARCGASLEMRATQHDQPPPGPPCEGCRLVFLADFNARNVKPRDE